MRARNKHKRNSEFIESIGNRIDELFSQIDVEKSDIEVCLFNSVRCGDDAVGAFDFEARVFQELSCSFSK